MYPYITRFAPSPTGHLHLGHAYSALIAYQAAISASGQFHLRIEDIDRTRCKPEYEISILDDLKWLGLKWETPVVRQSDNLSAYDERVLALVERGLVYRCFLSRREVDNIARAPHGAAPTPFTGAPLSSQEEKARLLAGDPYAWRLSLSAVRRQFPVVDTLVWSEKTKNGLITHPARFAVFGDVILGRKDSGTSYHIASVHDDNAAGVTHVIRGEDLRETAGLHRLLYTLFDLPPPIYQHHQLIMSPDGKRLAKRDKAETLGAFRASGKSPEDLAALVGLSC